MRVILLCAGYATRLYPLTKTQPKPLLSIGGRPMLDRILDRVQELPKVKSVVVVSNHFFAGHFEKWAQNSDHPWPIEVVDDQTTSNETRLGAIGDLRYALKQKNISKEDVMVVAGDNFFDFNLRRFVEFSESKRPHAVIAVYDVKDRELAKQYGLVGMAKDGKVTQFFEKPKDPPTTLASCGIYWLPAESLVLLDKYIAAGHNSDQPGHYMRWLAETNALFATPLEGHWLDIGDLQSYEKANEMFREFERSSNKEQS